MKWNQTEEFDEFEEWEGESVFEVIVGELGPESENERVGTKELNLNFKFIIVY